MHFLTVAFLREKDRFQPGQGTELLTFLAQIVEHRLEACLTEDEIEKLR